MSRCFPFPPPGYEKSARIGENNEDLLKKEKHKEKKHKKDKKDKEKGEKKERKNKDRSKDKRKERKDRKEKHKDDKDKNRTPENTRTETQPELHHEDLFGYDHKVEKVEDFKFREELVQRIGDEKGGDANQMAGDFASTTQRRLEGMGTSTAMEMESDRGNKMVLDLISTAQRRYENLTPSSQTKTDRMDTASASTMQKAASIEKLSSTITAGEEKNHVKVRSFDYFKGPSQNRVASSEKPSNVNATEAGKNHVTGQPVENFTGPFKCRAEGMFASNSLQNADNLMGSDHKNEGRVTANSIQKERPGSNNGTSRPVGDVVGSIGRSSSSFTTNTMPKERSSNNNMVLDFVGAAQRKSDRLGQQQATQKIAKGYNTAFLENKTVERTDDGLEKATNKKKERKEKSKEKKTEFGKREELKDSNGNEKKSKRKDKDRHKEKEKEEKISKSLIPCVENRSARASATEVNNKKRKDNEINGFLHKVDERPNKLPRTSATPCPPAENGKTLELSLIPSTCSPPIKLDAINNTKKVMVLDNKETVVNGKVEAHPSSVVLRPPVVVGSGGSGKIPSRSYHPDEKYLSKVCCVPKMAEWPESDDQEWLFSSEKPRPLAKLETDELPEVWAKGSQIESADVFALPYVIPF